MESSLLPLLTLLSLGLCQLRTAASANVSKPGGVDRRASSKGWQQLDQLFGKRADPRDVNDQEKRSYYRAYLGKRDDWTGARGMWGKRANPPQLPKYPGYLGKRLGIGANDVPTARHMGMFGKRLGMARTPNMFGRAPTWGYNPGLWDEKKHSLMSHGMFGRRSSP